MIVHSRLIGCGGGLIRVHSGGWVKEFIWSIGVASSVDAELRALRVGLILSIRLNLLANIIKTKKKNKNKKKLLAFEKKLDAKTCLAGYWRIYSNLYHAFLIVDCKTFINQIPQVRRSIVFVKLTNVQILWLQLEKDWIQANILCFLKVHLWNYVCCYFMTILVCTMRGYGLFTLTLFSFF